MSETAVTSFIIRFIQETEDDNYPQNWRGVIRNIQTCEELPFTSIEDALKFIGLYVNIIGAEGKPESEDTCHPLK